MFFLLNRFLKRDVDKEYEFKNMMKKHVEEYDKRCEFFDAAEKKYKINFCILYECGFPDD